MTEATTTLTRAGTANREMIQKRLEGVYALRERRFCRFPGLELLPESEHLITLGLR